MSGSTSPGPAAERRADLQAFLDAAEAAYAAAVRDAPSRASVARIFAALRTPAPAGDPPAVRLPACAALAAALRLDGSDRRLRTLAECFAAIEPRVAWRHRPGRGDGYDDCFYEGHANGMVCGPGGLEERSDLLLGATVMTPGTRYPDHAHAPEEVYLVLAPGEFRQDRGAWFDPGVGGSFYNPPGILHAMRAVDRPFLAFWALWVGR